MKNKNLTPIQSVIEKINDSHAFAYGVAEYDYDRSRNNCRCGDYCRCSVIVGERVTSVKPDEIFKILTADINDVILTYCIDRTVRASKVMDLNSWEVNITGGYYGEEVHGVRLIDSVKSELIKSLSGLGSLSDVDMIKKVLEYEYGYVLPKLADAKYTDVVKVKLDDVKLFNDQYMRKVSKSIVDSYVNYDLPRSVCLKEGYKYVVIDGYHRMMSAQQQKLDSVRIIELK